METKTPTISVALATYNEEENITRCLSSIKDWVNEIVVVDGGSSDGTVKIAKTFRARVITTDNPPIFHINKQKAIEACHGDWILQLDADEVVSSELAVEIKHVIFDARSLRFKARKNGYYIPRKNFFLGHWLRKGGQYPDHVTRLFQNGKGRFPQKSVHEQIIVDGEVGYLRKPLLHYSYRTLSEYWKKANIYTSLTTEELKERNVPKNLLSYFEYNFLKPLMTFFSLFLRHKGFLDGWYGFLFALFSALHHSLAYKKYLALSKP